MTVLVANSRLFLGHETTSGLMSFLFYNLLKNPSALQRARAEVDEVVGESQVEHSHLKKIPYITACLRETLRLNPTASVFNLTPKKDEILGGEYFVKKGTSITCLLPAAHRDLSVFGEDADSFKPERMLDEPFNSLPPNAWKVKHCISNAKYYANKVKLALWKRHESLHWEAICLARSAAGYNHATSEFRLRPQ